MDKQQHLLACVAEEAGEIAQVCGKALRFGLLSDYTGTTNEKLLLKEVMDLLAVLEMMVAAGVLNSDAISAEDCTKHTDAKKAKVEKYMECARAQGILT